MIRNHRKVYATYRLPLCVRQLLVLTSVVYKVSLICATYPAYRHHRTHQIPKTIDTTNERLYYQQESCHQRDFKNSLRGTGSLLWPAHAFSPGLNDTLQRIP